MEWIELEIKTTSAGIEMLESALTYWGYEGFVTEDSSEFEGFLEANRDYWDYVDEELESKMRNVSRILLYLEDNAAVHDRVAELRGQLQSLKAAYPELELGTLDLGFTTIRDEDWANSWKQYYKPISIGEKLMIVPEWLNPENPEQRITVRLDPGLIFGTGNHASTRMCLCAAEQAVAAGDKILDLGSGSGILSIASLQLGASYAVGIDIDPKAEKIARENAAFNGIGSDRFRAETGNVLDGGDTSARISLPDGYDIVFANIVADVIIPLSTAVPQFLKQDGLFICSGILNTRLDEVTAALEAVGLEIRSSRMEEDWCCLTAALRN